MKPFFLSLLLSLSAVLPMEAFGAPPDDVRARLDKARDDTALAEATVERLARRLEDLCADPDASPDAIRAMETYHAEAKAMFETHCATLAELERMVEESPASPDPEVTRGMREFAETVAGLPEAEEADGELARLLAEFDDSLNQFDRLIHDHFHALRTAMDRRIATGNEVATTRARAAAEAAALLRGMGVDPGVEIPEGVETASSEPQTGTVEPGTPGSTGEGRTPGEDAPPRRDEDIVARQLREAAEKETDPELREKLWEEYEAYLDGRG